ncbi:hypothetical protein [Streptomyces beijiangensis]|uniref:Uncharacterized protein n=1 Tax=Streptomyces beijiangensis TaxID=163361 RepID=A0A939JLV5_9ACTN|nr:hypothetical protein [Streptomyces beijiangensis]MBO0516785.1 hypothetical protein [Streptomyces beijiangensis]
MAYLQIALGLTEFLCAGAAYWQMCGRRDPLLIPLVVIVIAAGVVVPRLFSLGHPTWFSLSLQALAVIALLLIAVTARRRHRT